MQKCLIETQFAHTLCFSIRENRWMSGVCSNIHDCMLVARKHTHTISHDGLTVFYHTLASTTEISCTLPSFSSYGVFRGNLIIFQANYKDNQNLNALSELMHAR